MSRTHETHSNNNPAKVWRTYSYDLDVPAGIAKMVARERYAWPGGYELFAFTDDSSVLCNDCCWTEFYNIKTSFEGDGWHCVGYGSTAETDEEIHCSHCSREIQAVWDEKQG